MDLEGGEVIALAEGSEALLAILVLIQADRGPVHGGEIRIREMLLALAGVEGKQTAVGGAFAKDVAFRLVLGGHGHRQEQLDPSRGKLTEAFLHGKGNHIVSPVQMLAQLGKIGGIVMMYLDGVIAPPFRQYIAYAHFPAAGTHVQVVFCPGGGAQVQSAGQQRHQGQGRCPH